MSDERTSLLATSPLMRGVAEREVAAIAMVATERRLRAGAVLFREGQPADALHVVLAGRVKMAQAAAEGQEVLVRFVGPGGLVAAVAVLAEAAYPATATAVEPSRLLLWQRRDLGALLIGHPLLAVNAVGLLAERVREMQERFRELATERVAQRVARALLRLARQAGKRTADGVLIDLRLSRQDLAEMTGTTLYSVSRILSEWQDAGVLATSRGRITVLSPHRLVAIAEDLPTASSHSHREI